MLKPLTVLRLRVAKTNRRLPIRHRKQLAVRQLAERITRAIAAEPGDRWDGLS